MAPDAQLCGEKPISRIMNAKTLLGISLVVNGLLLGTAAFLWKENRGRPASPPPAVVHVTNTNPAPVEKPVAAVPTPAQAVAAPTAGTNTFDWHRVESPDYRQYIANLRAIGCPEKTIRDIITADVNEMFRERAKGQSSSTNRFEYWKSGNPLGNMFNEEMVTKQQELSKEKRELLAALLGDSAPTGLEASALADSSQHMFGQMLDFLPADKVTPVMELEQKYGAKLMDTIKSAQQGDTAAMRKVMAEKDAEMLQLLTPEQKFEYDLRMSQSAMVMRMRLGDFEPTEQQFREMFKVQKSFDDEFGLTGMTGMGLGPNASAAEKARYGTAQKELTAQLQNILGEDGSRLYAYEKRWMYDPLNRIAKDNNIPKDTAFRVFDLQKAAQAEAAKVQANQALSAEQRTAALAAMQAETQTAVGQVLGNEAAAQAYLKKAQWIKKLAK